MTTLRDGYKTASEHIAECDECQRYALQDPATQPEQPIVWPTEAEPPNRWQRFVQTLAGIFSR